MQPSNRGFDPAEIAAVTNRIKEASATFVFPEPAEVTEECARFLFVGTYEERPVVYDGLIYTLRLHHESELFEIAEQRVREKFPAYNPEGNTDAAQDEEIGMFMAEVIAELQEEDALMVQEHCELDDTVEYGIGLSIALHVEEITPQLISSTIRAFIEETLRLDPTSYTFQLDSSQED